MEQLFRQTDLESRMPLNMNVLDKGLVPRVMSLKEALLAFIDHRREVLERRTAHRLEKIAARLEVLEGYLAVFLNLDKVIKIIRTEDEPKPKLMKAFELTRSPGRSHPQHAAAVLAQARGNGNPRRARCADQGAEGAEEAARLRQAEIRTADRGDESRSTRNSAPRPRWASAARRSLAPRRSRKSRPSPRKPSLSRRRSSANPSPSSARKRAGCARSRAIRNRPTRSNTAKATARVSGFTPRPPTS